MSRTRGSTLGQHLRLPAPPLGVVAEARSRPAPCASGGAVVDVESAGRRARRRARAAPSTPRRCVGFTTAPATTSSPIAHADADREAGMLVEVVDGAVDRVDHPGDPARARPRPPPPRRGSRRRAGPRGCARRAAARRPGPSRSRCRSRSTWWRSTSTARRAGPRRSAVPRPAPRPRRGPAARRCRRSAEVTLRCVPAQSAPHSAGRAGSRRFGQQPAGQMSWLGPSSPSARRTGDSPRTQRRALQHQLADRRDEPGVGADRRRPGARQPEPSAVCMRLGVEVVARPPCGRRRSRSAPARPPATPRGGQHLEVVVDVGLEPRLVRRPAAAAVDEVERRVTAGHRRDGGCDQPGDVTVLGDVGAARRAAARRSSPRGSSG